MAFLLYNAKGQGFCGALTFFRFRAIHRAGGNQNGSKSNRARDNPSWPRNRLWKDSYHAGSFNDYCPARLCLFACLCHMCAEFFLRRELTGIITLNPLNASLSVYGVSTAKAHLSHRCIGIHRTACFTRWLRRSCRKLFSSVGLCFALSQAALTLSMPTVMPSDTNTFCFYPKQTEFKKI